ncbi:MAG: QueT transporter family protein [Eubacteriales bacterium]|nr:QueT transporter family protein [Eubacteriales bacterium]
MKQKQATNVYFLTSSAVIAAVYVVLTLALAPISFGPVQFRVSEMLCVLPAFTPAGIYGVTIGCLLANILGGAMLPDIVFGTLATLLGALGTYVLCRGGNAADALSAGAAGSGADSRFLTDAAGLRYRLCAVLPPIVSNAVIIPLVLKYAYHMEDAVWFMVLTVGLGEVLAVGVLGNLLMGILHRYRGFFFRIPSVR